MAKLKHCPFCESKPDKYGYWADDGYTCIIECSNRHCGARIIKTAAQRNVAIKATVEAWEKR